MDNQIWAFVIVSVMWTGVLFYMFQLSKKVSRLEKLLDESDES